MANYDLSEFVKSQKQSNQHATIKINDDHVYKIKKSAWAFLQLSSITEKYKNNSAKIGQEVIRTFLGEEALKFIEGDSVPAEVRMRIFTIIVSEITGVKEGSAPDGEAGKK